MEKSGQRDGKQTFKITSAHASEVYFFPFHVVLAVGECSAVMGFTPCMLCTDSLCVVCSGLLSAEFSTVNTELGRPMFWKPMCLFSTPEGLAAINYLTF